MAEEGAVVEDPCRDCGACCRNWRISFYHGELDSQPGGSVPAEMAVQVDPFRACMKGTQWGDGACVALTVDNRCAIYGQRPSTCREFPALIDGKPNPECDERRKRAAASSRCHPDERSEEGSPPGQADPSPCSG